MPQVLRLDGFQGESEFLTEVEVLSKVCHPNIVMLLGCCRDRGRQCLVYEWMDNGSLQQHLDRRSTISWRDRLRIAMDVTRALCFLHELPSQAITHHDIKPANILLDDRFSAKVSDVGLARVSRPRLPSVPAGALTVDDASRHGASEDANTGVATIDQHRVGTLAYMDPEYRETGILHPSCDIYALGICLMQLVTAMPPHGLPTIVQRAINTGKLSSMLDLSDPYAGQWPLAVLRQMFSLALKCTAPRDQRPTLNEIMSSLKAASILDRQSE